MPMPPPKASTEGPRDRQVFHEMGQIVRALEATRPAAARGPPARRRRRLLGARALRPGARASPSATGWSTSPPRARWRGRLSRAASLGGCPRPAATTCTPRRTARRGGSSSSATGCSARAATGPRSPSSWPPDHRMLLVDMPHHGRSAWTELFDYLGPPTRSPGCCRPTTPSRWSGTRWAARSRCWWRCATPSWSSGWCVVDVSPVAYRHTDEFRGYIDAMQAARPRGARPAGRRRRAAARGGARRRRPVVPAAEPPPRPGRVVLAAQPRRPPPRPRVPAGVARGRAGRHRAVRRAGAVARAVPSPRYVRDDYADAMDRWFPTQPPGARSRAPGTGSTPSSPRCSSRCCAGSCAEPGSLRAAGAVGRHGVAVAARGRAVAA